MQNAIALENSNLIIIPENTTNTPSRDSTDVQALRTHMPTWVVICDYCNFRAKLRAKSEVEAGIKVNTRYHHSCNMQTPRIIPFEALNPLK